MDSASLLRSISCCSAGSIVEMRSFCEKPGALPKINSVLHNSSFAQGLKAGSGIILSPMQKKVPLLPYFKASESMVVVPSDCSAGSIVEMRSFCEKPGALPKINSVLHNSSFAQGLKAGSGIILSPMQKKVPLLPYFKASESMVGVPSDSISSGNKSQGLSEKKDLHGATFPNGFESLVLEVCDETDVAELKLKVGDFEMHLKRNIGMTKASASVTSPSVPPPVPSKPMVESVPAAPSTPSPPQKSSAATTNPFTNASLAKASKLAAIEGAGSNAYIIVSSPTVGSFRWGRTIKGKKQPPVCKEGDIIKEGQVIGYLDQFGSQLPVKSEVAGEIVKLLYKDGEAVGYGDPLAAILPSFHGIK